jgi:iron complex outermembrane recepter protein
MTKNKGLAILLSMCCASALYGDELIKLEQIGISNQKRTDTSTSTIKLNKEATTASRLGITIKETPASVEVVNSDVMKQRGDTTIEKAIEKTTGITTARDPGSPIQFSARGFATNGVNLLYNGVKIPGGTNMSIRPMDSANIDRIEIIHGASSVLHGEGSVGASINLITKQPSFSKQDTELDYSYGSFNTHRFHFGAGGTLAEDVLAYRFDYSRSEGGTTIDDEKNQLSAVALSLLYKIDDDLLATLSVEKTEDKTDNAYHGTPLVNGKLDESLRKKNYNKLEDGLFQSDNLWLRAGLEWYLSSSTNMKNQFYYYDSTRDWRTIAKFTYLASTNQVQRDWFNDMDHNHKIIGDRLDITNQSTIFGLDNKLAIGIDVSKTDFQSMRPTFKDGDIIDASNPPSKYFSEVSDDYKRDARDVNIKQGAVYMEEQLSLTDSFKLVGGLRYDVMDTEWIYIDQVGNPKESKKHNNLTYRVGTVYDVLDTTTLYATYATAVEPGATFLLLRREQTQLDLTEAKQIEIGVKQSFWEGKGQMTAAAYQITKENLFVPDPNDPTNLINAGEQSSQGVEFGIGLRPNAQWEMDVNIAKVDAEYDDYYTASTSYNGNIPAFVPEYVANFGLRYMPTEKLGIGTWVRYVDTVYGNDVNTIELPSYTTVDLNFNYKVTKQIKLGAVVKNLTDEFYATRTRSDTSAIIADPRTYEVSASFKF